MRQPKLLYIPGLLPKPEPALHRQQLARCLAHGLADVDETLAGAVRDDPETLELVSWTYDFYGEHRDLALDAPSIDRLLEQTTASMVDKREATSMSRRLLRNLYLVGDWLPFLIPWLANERIEAHIRDLNRYVYDDEGIAKRIREQLVGPLRAAKEEGRPVILLAHSMGSVIAWDVLWELCHVDQDDLALDMLITMGSPLGQTFIQKRIAGADQQGSKRYPCNIQRWTNVSAWGDLTAIDPHLANDFREMQNHQLIGEIMDQRIYTWFRLNGALNVHAEYGYLANRELARCIADAWRSLSD